MPRAKSLSSATIASNDNAPATCWTIYCHVHRESGKRYVGQTRFSMDKRWREHVSEARGAHRQTHFSRAVARYGQDAFEHYVLERCNTQELANVAEQMWIRHFNSSDPKNGFNVSHGGGGFRLPEPVAEDVLRDRIQKWEKDNGRRLVHKEYDALVDYFSGPNSSSFPHFYNGRRYSEVRMGYDPNDLSGKTFGRLLVTDKCEKRKRNGTWRRWHLCLCSCPEKTEKWVMALNLKQGQTRSCGCLGREEMSPEAVRARKQAHHLLHDGSTITVSELCQRTGLSRNTVRGRLQKGHTADDILHGRQFRALELHLPGGASTTVKKIAQETGLSRAAVQQRLRSGWSAYEILRGKRSAPASSALPRLAAGVEAAQHCPSEHLPVPNAQALA